MAKTIIIGASAAGATAATRLRRLNEDMQIILLEKGEHISYANCGMPYYIGGVIKDKEDLTVMTPSGLAAWYKIDVRIRNEVIFIDRDKKEVIIIDHANNRQYKENYDYLILATGAEPVIPLELQNIYGVFALRDLSDTFALKSYIENNKPKNAVILGGGAIGLELAENLVNSSIDVTILELSDRIGGPLDFDMASLLHSYLRKNGVKLILNNSFKSILTNSNKIILTLSDGNVLETDMVIVSIGVKPNSSLAKQANLKINARGAVVVNSKMQTTDPYIYAIGDLVEVTDYISKETTYIPLAGPAQKQARIVANNISGINTEYNGASLSGIIKIFDKTVAYCGLNEKILKAKNIDYEKVYITAQSNPSYYPDSGAIDIKLLFDKISGKIYGVQLIGDKGVDKRADVFATVIRLNGTIDDLVELELTYSPPYSTAKDAVNLAGLAAQNVKEKIRNIVHFEDLDKINHKNTILLDVRTKKEFEKGHIDGFINIPLHELRDRINELDTNKTIYVMCLAGQRAYVAERLLRNQGFNAFSLSGGYRLYKHIIDEKLNKG
ncbi:MAG TPA: FAD-dependent oxidoreductase [Clostridia bacterium]|jgi:NADPH-dependent 2,4-dienoyl-CoA reductase/sulfur reductase-like enzyme/rhodanese-related sulfurtransferase